MKRPSFQFYPADWRNNAKLRRCSEAARGAWMDILCVLHDSDEYGVVRWPLADLARAAGVSLKLVRELVEKDVLKGGDKGCAPYVYTPRSGRVEGDPVVLVTSEPSKPCWYCSRFVRDEYVRQRRGNATQFASDNQPPKRTPKSTPKPHFGEPQGDGPTSSSTSTSKSTSQPAARTREAFRMHPDWRPSDHFPDLARQAGHTLTDEKLAEFRLYWLTRTDQRTQAEWDKALLQSLQHDKLRAQSQPKTAEATKPRRSNHDERAETIAGLCGWDQPGQAGRTIEGSANAVD